MDFYQIKILGSPYRVEQLKSVLSKFNMICFVDGEPNHLYPLLYLYFAQSNADRNCDNVDLKQLEQNLQVLPVIKDIKNCNNYLPDDIQKINALELSGYDSIEKLSNFILKYFGLIDVNRKVFISYKRDDCQGLAQQLFVELSKRNFIPFLDSYIIEPSVNFQEHLKHELSDCEIMLFLNSSNFGDSKWCKEELAIASEIQAAIVQLRFNDAKDFKEADFSHVILMGPLKGKMDEYPEQIDLIMTEIEKYRAIGFEIRRKSLVSLLNDKYPNAEFINTSTGVLISEKLKLATYVLNRIPTSVDLQNADDRIEGYNVDSTFTKSIAFNGMYCRHDISEHHEWLNSTSIPVKFNDITKE